MNGRLHLRLTPRLTLIFVLFAAVLLVFVGVLAYYSGRSGLETATISTLLSESVEKEAALDDWIQERQSDLAMLAASPAILENVIALIHAQTDSTKAQAARNQLVAELRFTTVGETNFLAVFVMAPETGKVIAATDSDMEGTYREDQPFFINGKRDAYTQNPYYVLSLQRPVMTLAIPFQDKNGRLLAVLAGHLDLNDLNPIITRRTGLLQTDDAFLVNTENLFVTQPRLLADPVVLQRGVHTEAVKRCLDGNRGVLFGTDYRNVAAIIAYRWLAERQLCLIVKMDQSEAILSVQAFGTALVASGGVALAAASLLGIGLARTITRPILALKTEVIRFGQGETKTRFSDLSEDEIGTLAHEFNMMANAIAEKETILINYTNELEQRVVERTAQLTFLADASRLLSESFDYADRLKQVTQVAVPHIADWCAVDILGKNGMLQRLAVVHTDPKKVELAYELQRRYPPDPNAPRGAYHVLRTGKSEFYPNIPDEMLVVAAPSEEILTLLRGLGMKSAMTVPLLAHGQVLGVLSLVTAESGRYYNENDLALAEDLARRAALLIDNSRLYHEAQQLNVELEKRVTERTTQLEASNRELEAFSYSVSHDLRAPLRAIDGFSRILLRDFASQLPEAAQRYLNLIRDSSQQMGTLIDDLLRFSRLSRQSLNRERVNPVSMIQLVIEELSGDQSNRQFEVTVGNLPECQADPALLKQVFVNLLSNALKFTRQRNVARIEVDYEQANGEIIYKIKDNGAGFDMAYADKLFGVFQRLHHVDEYPGTGVGLAIVQRIVYRHGGRIWAEAEVDQGATFYFTLEGEGSYD
jgi:signal transduction histidine kinase